jgi:hypothetical protein
MQLQPGQLIRAPFLSAPAEVKKFEPRSGYYLLEVVLGDGHHTFKPLRITADQLAQQERMPAQKVGHDLLRELPALTKGQVILAGDAVNTPTLCQARQRHTRHRGESTTRLMNGRSILSQARWLRDKEGHCCH